MNKVADVAQAASPLPAHASMMGVDLLVIAALVIAGLIAFTWVCWKAQSRD